MLNVDEKTFLIEMTRGDTANIMFSAVDDEDNPYTPSVGDVLKFAVAKKVGVTPIFQITNVMESSATDFWTIQIEPDHTEDMKFGDYVYDVQLQTVGGETDTIIGKTDDISPTFRVWGEVATE